MKETCCPARAKNNFSSVTFLLQPHYSCATPRKLFRRRRKIIGFQKFVNLNDLYPENRQADSEKNFGIGKILKSANNPKKLLLVLQLPFN